MRALKVLFYSIITLVVIAFGVGNFVEKNKITGEGDVQEKSIDVSGFDEIEVGSIIQVYLRTDSTYSLKVSAQGNLHEHIRISVEGSVLEIDTEGQISSSEPIKVWVSAPRIQALSSSGASHIVGQNLIETEELSLDLSGASGIELELAVQSLECELSGASELRLKGSGEETDLNGSGASKCYGHDYLTRIAQVDLSGASFAEMEVSESLEGKISGAGKMNYRGSPVQVDLNLSGAGSAHVK